MKSEKKATIKNKPEINLLEVLGDFKVHIAWDKADGADKYDITRSISKDGPFSKVATVSFDVLSFTDETIENEGLYWYKVTAFKSMGKEKPLKKAGEPMSANITTMIPPVLEAIKNNDNKSISISWKCEEDVTAFNILRRFDFMKKAMKIDEVDDDQTAYTDDDFERGQLFYYSVQSVIEGEDDIRYSNPSNELCAVCLDKPLILSVKRKHGKKIIVSLRLTTGADGYALFKSESENGEYKEVSRTDSISEHECFDKGLKGEKGAYYKAACFKKCGKDEFIGPKTDSIFIKYKL